MTELMRLYSTDLRSASDTLLDLGTSSYRWNNLYLRGSINNIQVLSASLIYASTINSTVTLATSQVSSPIVNCSTTNAVVIKADSSIIMQMAGSSIALNNGTNSCINARILIVPPPIMADGNVWFFSSSNFMYLAVRSNNANYYVLMAT